MVVPRPDETQDLVLTYPGWQIDREHAKKLLMESSNSSADLFHRKLTAMKNKQRLLVDQDRSHPDLKALDECTFTYPGWQLDRAECEKRHVGDCNLLHVGSLGVHDLLQKMGRKESLFANRASVAALRDLDSQEFDYDGWQTDKAQAETYYVEYACSCSSADVSTDDCFSHKVRGMQNKQRLHEGDRSHPDIVALDSVEFNYPGHDEDREEALRRHTGDCKSFHMGGFLAHLSQMKKKQQMHDDRSSLPGLQELDNMQLTYPGCDADKALCEKYFVDYSTQSTMGIFHRKLAAMTIKQQLYEGDRQSDPNIRVLDTTHFSYDGWEEDKKQAERRLTSDCVLLHMGSIGFNDAFSKMIQKQAAHDDRAHSTTAPLYFNDLAITLNDSGGSTFAPPITSANASVRTLSYSLLSAGRNEKSVTEAMAENNCVVCLDQRVTHAYIPCGHLCACSDCVTNYDSASDRCPLCRERSYCVTKIYC